MVKQSLVAGTKQQRIRGEIIVNIPIGEEKLQCPSSSTSGVDSRFLFYDQSKSPTKLVLDNRLFFRGNYVASYDIVPKDDPTSPISRYYSEDGMCVLGSKIPLRLSLDRSFLLPLPCSTELKLVDNQQFWIQLYDYQGHVIERISCISKELVIVKEREELPRWKFEKIKTPKKIKKLLKCLNCKKRKKDK